MQGHAGCEFDRSLSVFFDLYVSGIFDLYLSGDLCMAKKLTVVAVI